MRWQSAAVAAVMMVGPLSADAGERSWYVGVQAGATFADVEATPVSLPLCGMLGFTCDPDLSTDAGLAAFGTVGLHLTDSLRLEGEFGYRATTFGGNGDLSNTTLMLNALFDVPVTDAISLAFGGGIGVDWISTERQVPTAFGPLDSSTTFAYQAIAELSWDITDTIDLTLTYRYLDTSDIGDLHADVNTLTAPGVASIDDFSASTVSVGLRFAL